MESLSSADLKERADLSSRLSTFIRFNCSLMKRSLLMPGFPGLPFGGGSGMESSLLVRVKVRADLSSGPFLSNLFERSLPDPGLPGTPFGLGGGIKSSSSAG